MGNILYFILQKMKKFSILLIGAFLFWTIAFVLADENKDANNLTGSVVAEPTPTSTDPLTTDTTTSENSEVAVDTTEAATTETTSAETTEATATETTTEATTWDTTETTTTDTAEAKTWDTAETTDTDAVETTGTEEETATATESENSTTSTVSDSAKEKYDEEQIAAYEWALEQGITTINDIEKARLADWLTRAELAKMMSQYMTKVLWKTPVDTEKANYADVDESLGDLADFIQTAYAYQIMWINADGTPLENFNPNGKVTRAEYATVFSRVLYGNKYNKAEWNYYEDHLAALKEAGILTNTTPTIQEIRGWVMLMMYRSVNDKAETTEESTENTQIANPAAEYCVAQWGTVNIVKDEEWNESGMCKLADGTEVGEWEYYRANNPETETWDTAEENTNEEINNEENTWAEEATGSTLTVTATPGKETSEIN